MNKRCVTHDGREVLVAVEWTEGNYTRGHVLEPREHRHERVGVWGNTILVRCVAKTIKGYNKQNQAIYDFVEVEANVRSNGSALVVWPSAHVGLQLQVSNDLRTCETEGI
jgi:hypothetical protein